MADISIKQLAKSLVAKKVLPEGTQPSVLLGHLQEAGIEIENASVNDTLNVKQMAKLLAFFRSKKGKSTVKEGPSTPVKKAVSSSSSAGPTVTVTNRKVKRRKPVVTITTELTDPDPEVVEDKKDNQK